MLDKIWDALAKKDGCEDLRSLYKLEENQEFSKKNTEEVLSLVWERDKELWDYLQDRSLQKPINRKHVITNLCVFGINTKPIMVSKRVSTREDGQEIIRHDGEKKLCYELVTTNDPATYLVDLLRILFNPYSKILGFDDAMQLVFQANQDALVSDKAFFGEKYQDSYTLLHLAVSNLQVEVVKILLNPAEAMMKYMAGGILPTSPWLKEILAFDVNCKNDAGRTPLDILTEIDIYWAEGKRKGALKDIFDILIAAGAAKTELSNNNALKLKRSLSNWEIKRSITHYEGNPIEGGEERFQSYISIVDYMLGQLTPAEVAKDEEIVSKTEEPDVPVIQQSSEEEVELGENLHGQSTDEESTEQIKGLDNSKPTISLWEQNRSTVLAVMGCVSVAAILYILRSDIKNVFDNLKESACKYYNNKVMENFTDRQR